jgi:hypothetical protein
VIGEHSEEFSLNPAAISYGSNSGFQALNLAILKGCKRIVLVGYDMRTVKGQRHFFGDHPKGLHNRTNFEDFVPMFTHASKRMPKDLLIVNATPESALHCFKRKTLEDALADDSVLRHGTEHNVGASAGGP